MNNEQIAHYKNKLAFEMDPSDLHDALKNNEKIVVIDARRSFAYDEERIPSAINLPHREMDESTTKHFDRSVIYVTYCDGIGCNASTKGALNMARLGFNVRELIGGLQWWKFDGYATEGKKENPVTTDRVACAC